MYRRLYQVRESVYFDVLRLVSYSVFDIIHDLISCVVHNREQLALKVRFLIAVQRHQDPLLENILERPIQRYSWQGGSEGRRA